MPRIVPEERCLVVLSHRIVKAIEDWQDNPRVKKLAKTLHAGTILDEFVFASPDARKPHLRNFWLAFHPDRNGGCSEYADIFKCVQDLETAIVKMTKSSLSRPTRKQTIRNKFNDLIAENDTFVEAFGPEESADVQTILDTKMFDTPVETTNDVVMSEANSISTALVVYIHTLTPTASVNGQEPLVQNVEVQSVDPEKRELCPINNADVVDDTAQCARPEKREAPPTEATNPAKRSKIMKACNPILLPFKLTTKETARVRDFLVEESKMNGLPQWANGNSAEAIKHLFGKASQNVNKSTNKWSSFGLSNKTYCSDMRAIKLIKGWQTKTCTKIAKGTKERFIAWTWWEQPADDEKAKAAWLKVYEEAKKLGVDLEPGMTYLTFSAPSASE